jgi:tetratricopeptide (TPR) repeat protein
MKKLSILIISLILFTGVINAQEPEITWEGLIKQKEKSDNDIQDPKKSLASKTWMNRAEVFLNIHTFEIGILYRGMPARAEEGYQYAEFLVGKPGKIVTDGEAEVWVYNRKKLYFIDGLLDHWEQTDFIDKDALDKSAQAYLKAIELDATGKLKDKPTSKDLLATIKNQVLNNAVDKYILKDYTNSYKLMSTGYELCKLPKNESDTIYTKDQVGYYLGIVALNAGDFAKSKDHFQTSINDNYQPGVSYHYLAESYAGLGDTVTYLAKVKEGFEKYPEEEQLIIDLINYYMAKKKANEAIDYIDRAISKYPENASYYSAKATIYDNSTETLMNAYKKYMDAAYEAKKEAFRDRNDPVKKAAADKRRDEAIVIAQQNYDEYINNLAKAEKLYIQSLGIDSKFFNAAYNLGRIDLKLNEINALHADYVYKIFKETDPNKSTEFENKAKDNLLKAAERFETAYKIDPKDRGTLEVLKRIYFRLRDKENENRVTELLNNLGAVTPGME